MTSDDPEFVALLAAAARLKIESNEAFWRAHDAWPLDKGSSEFMDLLKAEHARQLQARTSREKEQD